MLKKPFKNGLKELDIPAHESTYYCRFLVKKKGFLGLFGKKPAVVDIEPIAETTVTKANQQAVKGVS